ncbi:MAG: Ribosomal-protein-alanine acetyltransferase [Fimbriimonadales bacterium]|nr:Ribosomal-protein-alanine acetyltransferase [Fimbriimonadales bacterium]
MRRTDILPMEERHLPQILAIEKESNPSAWSESGFRSELTNPQAHYFVALQDGTVAGYAGYWSVIDEAHITNVAVSPEHRRKGMGRTLVQYLLKDAAKRGIRCATLEVRAGNIAAISLYESMGFVACGVRKRYYPADRSDAVVMWLFDIEASD